MFLFALAFLPLSDVSVVTTGELGQGDAVPESIITYPMKHFIFIQVNF